MKLIIVTLGILLSSLHLTCQSEAWSKTKAYSAAPSNNSVSRLKIFEVPTEMPPSSQVEFKNTPLGKAENVLIHYFSINNTVDLESILFEKSDIFRFNDKQLSATVDRRKSGSKVFIESVLELELEDDTYAFVKFFIEERSLKERVFGVQVTKKRDNKYYLAPSEATNIASAFLIVDTKKLSDILTGNVKNEQYSFMEEGSLNINDFIYTINKWAQEDDYSNHTLLQNIGWND